MLAKIRAQLLELDTSVRTIGRFEILSRLGAGGMGTVWAARDPELDRKVAIKFLHDAVDPGERLRREAQALARLRHPNIVGVHEIGVDAPTGRKFVVMELVEGGDLAAWLATPRPWPSIVAVFVAASRGLAAAHAAGLVHCDFKPQNVLVTRGADDRVEPEAVRVADFGLARLGIGEGMTGPAGTPGYIAPELVAGDPPTPASDQYAFCVALRAALFDRTAPRRDPPPRRLRAIVERGLGADPTARWPDMTALARALERGARPRPVAPAVALALPLAFAAVAMTAPPTVAPCDELVATTWSGDTRDAVLAAFDRLEHPSAMVTGRFVVSQVDLFVAGLRERRLAVCELARIVGPRDASVVHRASCLGKAELVVQASVERLLDANTATLLGAAALLPTPAAVEACDDVASLATEVEIPPAQEAEQLELLAAMHRAARRADLGEVRPALDELEALATRARALAHAPTTAVVLLELARAHRLVGDKAASIPILREAGIEAERGGADHSRARVLDSLARRLADAGQLDAAREAASAASALDARLGTEPASAEVWARLREAHIDEIALGPEAALPHHQRVLAVVDAHPERLEYLRAEALVALASNELELMRIDDARAHLQEALALTEAKLGPDHPALASIVLDLAGCDVRDGQLARAEAGFQRVLELRGRIVDDDDPTLAPVLTNLGAVRFSQGDFAAALTMFERALAIRTQQWGPDHIDLAPLLANLSFCLGRLGRNAEALAAAERALSIRIAALGPDHPSTGKAHHAVAIAARRNADPARARAEFERAIAVARRTEGTPELYEPMVGLVEVLLEQGELREVERLAAAALPGCEALEGVRTTCAMLEFAWAQAIAPRDAAAAIAKAESARRHLEGIEGEDGARAELDAWIATHRGAR